MLARRRERLKWFGKTAWKGNAWQGLHSRRYIRELQTVLWLSVPTMRHDQQHQTQERGNEWSRQRWSVAITSLISRGQAKETQEPLSAESLEHRPQHFWDTTLPCLGSSIFPANFQAWAWEACDCSWPTKSCSDSVTQRWCLILPDITWMQLALHCPWGCLEMLCLSGKEEEQSTSS